MSKRIPATVTIAKITVIGTITVALVSLIGNLILGYWQFGPDNKDQPITTPDLTSLAMEAIPRDVFVFAGNDNPDGGRGKFSLIYYDENIPNYRMEYSLPEDKYGYAGMVFRFPKGYNLSAYKTVEFTISLKAPGDQIDLFVKDISGHDNSIRIVNNGKDEMNLSYEFTNFPSINFNAVMEIGAFASTYFIKGSHDVWVKNIRFVK